METYRMTKMFAHEKGIIAMEHKRAYRISFNQDFINAPAKADQEQLPPTAAASTFSCTKIMKNDPNSNPTPSAHNVEEPKGQFRSGGMCDTTNTLRVEITNCVCPTYTDNLGPCLKWDENAINSNGRCVYCDHNKQCHDKVSGEQGAERTKEAEATEMELLPCPFCGGKELDKLQTFEQPPCIKFVRCQVCKYGWLSTEEWNTRQDAGRRVSSGVSGAATATQTDSENARQATERELEEKCEGCGNQATTYDSEAIPLCAKCAALP